MCCLTFARLLVRTKAQNKIDARIKLLFEHGSCDVWVKESIWQKGNLSVHPPQWTEGVEGVEAEGEQHGMEFDSAEGVEAALEPIAIECASVPVIASVNSCKPVCTSSTDPLLVELVNRPEWTDEYTWYDPIVVNETAGWLMTKSNDGPRSYSPQCGGLVELYKDTMPLRSQSKNPRGRPRKKRTQQQCDTPIPSLSKSCLEAMDSWNTAKLLGVSSSDEDAIISGLRKSKRLLIMDGKFD